MAILLQALLRAARHRLRPRSRPGLPRRLSALRVLAALAAGRDRRSAPPISAEVIGTAIGLNLLFGCRWRSAGDPTALDVFLILWMQNLGFRWSKAFIVTLLGAHRGLLRRPDRVRPTRNGAP
jgi:manganese transport protein